MPASQNNDCVYNFVILQYMKHFAKNKSIITILIICLIIISTIVLFFVSSPPSDLDVQAVKNKNYLDSITILEGYKLQSTARPDGDWLTASDALAIAEINVDDSLENIYNKTMANLKAQGYTGDGYTNTSSSNKDIYFKTINGNKSIVLEYKFVNAIDCSKENNFPIFCADSGYKTIDTSGLKNMKINKIRVVYDNDDKEDYQQ